LFEQKLNWKLLNNKAARFVLALIACAPLLAQETQVEPATAPASSEKPPDKHLFGVLPNYRTADATKPFAALTPKQKFTIAVHDSFDPPGYGIAAWYTLIYHLENTNPDFGPGLKGYAHRYGTTYADQMIGNMMTEGLMPTLLHEDPRYYRRAHGAVPVRAAWAVSRIFVTRTDSNKYRFNTSEFAGNFATAGIASLYYPQQRSMGDLASRFSAQIISDTISNELKEFWPDIKRKLHLGSRRKKS
jgi:hypothetical protein